MALPVYKDTSNSARIAVVYITLGALLVVWTAIWSIYLMSHGPVRDVTWYWVLGFLLSGLTLLGIGFGIGRIGRTAKQADVSEQPPVTNPPAANAALPMAVPVVTAPPAAAAPPTGNSPPQNNNPPVTI